MGKGVREWGPRETQRDEGVREGQGTKGLWSVLEALTESGKPGGKGGKNVHFRK